MSWSEHDTVSSIPERFWHQVRLGPERPAIAGTSRAMNYGELGALVDRYANALPARGEDAQRVALLLSHDGPLLAAALAALGRGLTVVTLNPGDPPGRHRQIRAAVEPQLLLTEDRHRGQGFAAGFAEADTIDLSSLSERAQGPAPAVAIDPDEIAFLICTSGSTGVPKVVMQSHRNMLHNVLRYSTGLGVVSEDRIAWLASLSGGQGLATAWTALLNGAALCPFAVAERGVTGLAEWLDEHGVTVFDTIPSVLRNFVRTLDDERISGVRLVRIASEGAQSSDFDAFTRHFADTCQLASVLASSEGGIIAQALLSSRDRPDEGRLPVGHPLPGIVVRVLDDRGDPVSDGEVGEIVLQGGYLSPGYWGDAFLTQRRFRTSDGSREFHTGDLGRRSPSGAMTIVGRADRQVKIRGHRLQLEEVEAALASHVDVVGAVLGARTTARGDTRLTAYLTTRPGCAVGSTELRRWLRTSLAPHAIPTAFVFLDELPLTPNGKIDSDRLLELEPTADSAPPVAAGISETEELLIALWSDALERKVDRHETFLELGGDSLTAAVIAAGVRDIFDVDMDLRVFLSDPTVAGLAALIDQRRTSASETDLPPLRRTHRMGSLSFTQERIWAQQPGTGSDAARHVAVPFRITGPLDVEALRESVEQIVRRHEILRTTFIEFEGRPMSVVRAPARIELPVDDLRAEPDPPRRAEAIIDSELFAPFSLEQGPLLRLRLLRIADEEYRLVRVSHHLIHDAASWTVFFRELAALYPALIERRSSALPVEPPLQYIDYAIWERAVLRPRSARYREEVSWWQREFEPTPPVLGLPFTREESDPALGDVGVIRWGIPAGLSDALDRLGRAAGATYFMTRLAGFAALLAMETGATDFVIGTPVTMRTRVELQNMIGPFTNVRLLRLRFAGELGFRRWLSDVRRAVIDTSARAAIPWEHLKRELVALGQPLPPVSASFTSWSGPELMRFGGIELEPLPRQCGATPVFRLGVNRRYESQYCWAEFDPRTHDPDRLQTFLGRLQGLMAAVCAEPERSLHDLHSAATLL